MLPGFRRPHAPWLLVFDDNAMVDCVGSPPKRRGFDGLLILGSRQVGESFTDDHLDSDAEILFRGGRGNSLAELLRYTGEVRVRGATQATSRPTSDSGTSRFQHEVPETQTNSRSLVYYLGHRPAYRSQDTCGLLIRSLPCFRHVRSRRPSDIQSTAGARPASLLRLSPVNPAQYILFFTRGPLHNT